MAISGACHCGAVRFELRAEPKWLTRCNCSACRRLGALWAHAQRDQMTLTYAADAVIRYEWGDRLLQFITCKTCGTTTQWEANDPAPDARQAVNVNLADPASIKHIRIRHFDGADTWQFLD